MATRVLSNLAMARGHRGSAAAQLREQLGGRLFDCTTTRPEALMDPSAATEARRTQKPCFGTLKPEALDC